MPGRRAVHRSPRASSGSRFRGRARGPLRQWSGSQAKWRRGPVRPWTPRGWPRPLHSRQTTQGGEPRAHKVGREHRLPVPGGKCMDGSECLPSGRTAASDAQLRVDANADRSAAMTPFIHRCSATKNSTSVTVPAVFAVFVALAAGTRVLVLLPEPHIRGGEGRHVRLEFALDRGRDRLSLD